MNRFGDIEVSNKRLPPVYGYYTEELVSLEQALEPIESQIKELPRFIKIAKKYCHYPSEHGLSKDQSAAIYIYTMEWGESTLYRVLNRALRSEDRDALKAWFPYLKLFDTALDLLPTVKEVVWRGVSLDIGKNFTRNQTFTWWSINSCSSSVKVIKNFLGNGQNMTLFLIETINGKKITGYTKYENEEEILLGMGTELRVKGDPLEQSNGSYIVHLTEITDDADDSHNNAEALLVDMSNMDLATTGIQVASRVTENAQWNKHGITVAGGNDDGDELNQLCAPFGLSIDNDQQTIYIADRYNHRIVEWKFNAKTGQVIAGGNRYGNRLNQLYEPTGVLVDTKNNSLIICDRENRRVVEWSRQNDTKNGQILISDIYCACITMDKNGYIYVSDWKKNEVRRWTRGETNGTIVAGGNGKGNHLNQLDWPTHLFVDEDDSVYVSDTDNHRVMKWMKNAKEGITVAGGQGKGEKLTQLSYPRGVIVDHLGNVYVVDYGNHRIMCWSKESKQGRIIIGGNGAGEQSNQLNSPEGISFDRDDNLYVADYNNHRVQKFEIDTY